MFLLCCTCYVVSIVYCCNDAWLDGVQYNSEGNNIEIIYRVDEHNVIIQPETWISQRFI